jgi:serine/threonine protein kinase
VTQLDSDPLEDLPSPTEPSSTSSMVAEAALGERFVLLRRLGQGGFGTVYEAHDRRAGVRVALKVLRHARSDWLHRFKREFRALQDLAHPNLVSYHELLFADGRWFLTMELLDGVDIVRFVRGSGSFDEGKLRLCLRQLFEGLAALHATGKIHCDIKPSNVLVTRDERVVLLDFGLVTEGVADSGSVNSEVVGTIAYMAPEQAASAPLRPPADLYAAGVMLYELLTGRLPHVGNTLQVLYSKYGHDVPSPATVADRVPADLDELCTGLLRFDAALRPSAVDALRTLSISRDRTSSLAPTPAPSSAPRASADAPIFVGRGAELAELESAFETTRNGELVTLLVSGESGIGKSSIARRFAGHLVDRRPDTLVLEGRCYEREAIPYKTLDGIIDALVRRLARLPTNVVEALLPARAEVLAQVFPVMRRIPVVAAMGAAPNGTFEPDDLRRRAFVALRDLFTRIALRTPTVLVIDDLHWADDDGLRALTEVLRPPDPPPLLFIGTVRVDADNSAVDRLRRALPGSLRAIELSGLRLAEARELAAVLLQRDGAAAVDPERVAREACGHPLFVEELARHLAFGATGVNGAKDCDDVRLDDAIWSRIERLDPATKAMAKLVAIAGAPLPGEVVAFAANFEPRELARRAAVLRSAKLVRTSGAAGADAVEPYHDRIREAVLARLLPDQRKTIHRALATAFEASSRYDAERLATHWREAGDRESAATHSVAAGDQASSAFAFDRAAQWYEQALDLMRHRDAADSCSLHMKLAEALAHSGRGAQAASHFEAAAALLAPREALPLKRRAAEQLLRTGLFDRGIEASRGVLAAIGMRLPTTRSSTILALAYYRVRLWIRGLGFREQDAASIPVEELARIDTCWSLGHAILCVDLFVGQVLVLRALLLALRAGDTLRITRGMVAEVALSALPGMHTWRRTEALIRHTYDLAARCGAPEVRWYPMTGEGAALLFGGRFRAGANVLAEALQLSREATTGHTWERALTRMMLVQALALLGRFAELRRVQGEGLRDSIERGDLWGSVTMRIGDGNLAWLIEDRPDAAEREARAALGDWSARGFHIQHQEALVAIAVARLYAGDAEAAHALVSDILRRMRLSFHWMVQVPRARARALRGCTALVMIARGAGRRSRLLRSVARDARALEREGVAWASAFARMLRAGLSLHLGSRAEAVRGLELAATAFDACEMAGYAEAVRDRAARLRGDASSAAEIARVAKALRAEGVVSPERMIAMLAPGFDVWDSPRPTRQGAV